MGTATKRKQEVELVARVDEAEVLTRVKQIERDLAATREEAGEIAVTDDDDYRVACALLLRVVEKKKYVEGERKGFLADVQKLIDRVEGWFARSLSDAEALEEALRGGVTGYALQVAARAHGLRVAATKLPAKDEDRAREMMDEANELKLPKVGGIAIVAKAKLVVTDESRIPAAYWKRVVDTKLLEAALAGGQKIPGAKLEGGMSVRVTPSNAKE